MLQLLIRVFEAIIDSFAIFVIFLNVAISLIIISIVVINYNYPKKYIGKQNLSI